PCSTFHSTSAKVSRFPLSSAAPTPYIAVLTGIESVLRLAVLTSRPDRYVLLIGSLDGSKTSIYRLVMRSPSVSTRYLTSPFHCLISSLTALRLDINFNSTGWTEYLSCISPTSNRVPCNIAPNAVGKSTDVCTYDGSHSSRSSYSLPSAKTSLTEPLSP